MGRMFPSTVGNERKASQKSENRQSPVRTLLIRRKSDVKRRKNLGTTSVFGWQEVEPEMVQLGCLSSRIQAQKTKKWWTGREKLSANSFMLKELQSDSDTQNKHPKTKEYRPDFCF